MSRMASGPSSAWISGHIHFDGPIYGPACDRLLRGIVDPLVRELSGSGLVDRFFFVRYPEGGSHVRLRLHVAAAGLEARVRDAVEARVGGEPEAAAGIRDLRWVPYAPEWDRYGGARGVEIAEDFFHVSSEAALDLLRDLPPEEDARLGRTLMGIVIFTHSFCPSRKSAEAFLRHYYASYLRSVAFAGTDEDDWLTAFSQGFAAQPHSLEEYVEEVWRRLASGAALPPALEGYRRRLGPSVSRFRRAQREGRLQRGEVPLERWGDALLGIVPSYLHMANNRMGVPIREEAYLSYLIAEALSGRRAGVKGGSIHV